MKSETLPANPLCHYDGPCARPGGPGVCEIGPPVSLSPGTINRALRCRKCHCTGDQASNEKAKR